MSRLGYRFVRTLIRWYPRAFRARFGDRMLEAFDVSREILRRKWGRFGSPLAYLRVTLDTLREAPIQHLHEVLDRPFLLAARTVLDPRNFRRELSFSLRSFRRGPFHSGALIVTLGLAIGANSALYAVVDRVLFHDMNVAEPDDVLVMWQHDPVRGAEFIPVSFQEYSEWKRASESFESMGAFATAGQWSLAWRTDDGDWRDLAVAPVTWEFFDVHRVSPSRGRLPVDSDFDRSEGRVAGVLSYGFWQRTFGESDEAIGTVMELPNLDVEVVGVAPPGVELPTEGDLWIVLTAEQFRSRVVGLAVVARMRPEVTRAAAFDEMDRLSIEVSRTLAADDQTGERLVASTLPEYIVGDLRPTLLLFVVAGALLFFLATSNAATLTLISFARRRDQFRMRSVLGATRADLAVALLADLAVPGVLAVALGMGVARLMLFGVSFLPDDVIPFAAASDLRVLDPAVLTFGAALSVLTILFLVGWTLYVGLRSSADTSRAPRMRGPGRATREGFGPLVSMQVALSVVLLSGAALLTATFAELQSSDRGFASDRLLTVSATLDPSDHGGLEGALQAYRQVLEEVAAQPGVESATPALVPPLAETGFDIQYVAEGQSPEEWASNPWANLEVVDEGYFDAMEIRIVHGRGFTTADSETSFEPVEGVPILFQLLSGAPAIVNEEFADEHWPDTDPIGRRFRVNDPRAPWLTIVGVTENSAYRSIADDRLDVYVPLGRTQWLPSQMLVRSSLPVAEVLDIVRTAVAGVAPSRAVQKAEPVDAIIQSELRMPRFRSMLAALFALTALALATVGIYGVVAAGVRNRMSEVGIRRTLGAPRGSVVRLLAVDAIRYAVVGMGLGLAGTMVVLPALEELLYSASIPYGAVVFGAMVVIVTIVAAAAVIPALRGLRPELRDVLSETGRAQG